MSGLLETRRPVTDAAAFGRVAVLLGGLSSEREVSLKSGAAVLKALIERGVDAHAWDLRDRSLVDFNAAGFDRAWNALHGPGGEDGAVQGALEWLGVPCTGSGVMASALAMDKIRSKQLFEAAGIGTPPYAVVRDNNGAKKAAEDLGLPLVVKPFRQGSSIGMSMVFEREELAAAISLALEYDTEILVERCIVGEEVTVAVLQGEALPSIRIETPRVFYDYRAKYESEKTVYVCPASDDRKLEERYAKLACAAFDALGCSGWGRVDFMHARGEEPLALEVNTVPGMTSHSLVPMAARAAGIDFPELCWRILETSLPANGDSITLKVAANGA